MLPKKLLEWEKQTGFHPTGHQLNFIKEIKNAAANGVGYGWMQQMIEWVWQEDGSCALGPEYFNKRIQELEQQIDNSRNG